MELVIDIEKILLLIISRKRKFFDPRKVISTFVNWYMSQLTFTSSKSTIETVEKGVKYVQS